MAESPSLTDHQVSPSVHWVSFMRTKSVPFSRLLTLRFLHFLMARICLKLPHQGSLTTIVGRNFSFSNPLVLVYLIPSLVPHAEQVLGLEAGPGHGSQGRQRSWNPTVDTPVILLLQVASVQAPDPAPTIRKLTAQNCETEQQRDQSVPVFLKSWIHCKHTALVREDRVIKAICRGLIFFSLTFRVLIELNSLGWKNSALFKENAQCSSPLSGAAFSWRLPGLDDGHYFVVPRRVYMWKEGTS